ncbi:hypothetical protein, partial [Lacticaseibacillus paracasei]|uniref:hypothetical protein n=1 Tax=Lacticaseibacillus paracasei TaxID=1597 RepID=UPI0021A2CCAE
MQTILRITSIRYRWLLGLLTLRVLIDGFNVLISALRYLELIGSLPTSSFFYTISIFERAKRTLH